MEGFEAVPDEKNQDKLVFALGQPLPLSVALPEIVKQHIETQNRVYVCDGYLLVVVGDEFLQDKQGGDFGRMVGVFPLVRGARNSLAHKFKLIVQNATTRMEDSVDQLARGLMGGNMEH